jgi:hypothetical protein
MRSYAYVGPAHIRAFALTQPMGTPIRVAQDLAPFATGLPLTFVIDATALLRVADQRSEHVACAGGGPVLSAGELTAIRAGKRIVVSYISNQSTGFCPEPESWPVVQQTLQTAGLVCPNGFSFAAIFRRCPNCQERNLVKDDYFVCDICAAPLPEKWNFV